MTWTCTGCGAELPAYVTHCPGSALVPRLTGERMGSVLNDSSDGHLKNANMPANTFEAKNVQGANVKDVTAGQNAGTPANLFEQWAAQEQGTH